jgi:hypothetical protein
MNFIAKAKRPGKCVYKPCKQPADQIFEDENWRVLACCEDHATIVLNVVNQFPRDLVEKVYWSDG